MLLRGSNLVGYTRYPKNLVEEFIVRAAEAGMDVFRIFDAFNDLDQMDLCVRTVLEKTNKLAEACICFTGDFGAETESVYTLDYYTDLARRMIRKWPRLHLLCVKDMAGLLTPALAERLISALADATGHQIPIHVHTHDTAGGQVATLLACVRAGAKVVDVASAAVSGLTSQPCM